MRIGLFTDTYHPSINGIVTVVDIIKKQFEAEGHEAYIFCQHLYGKGNGRNKKDDPKVIRFPGVESAFFDDYGISAFFPPMVLRKIKKLDLDVIIFFTPGQVGLMGVYAAKKLDIPLVSQHSTDLYEYVDHYPMVIPGIMALATIFPFHIRMNGKDAREWLKSFTPRRKWGKKTIERLITLLYQKCDAAITLSRKSYAQISNWKGSSKVNLTIMPTGVDPLPRADKQDIEKFRLSHGIKPDQKVALYVGRLSPDKNLEILIPAMEKVLNKNKDTQLLMVGYFEYEEELKRLSEESSARDNIKFTGRMSREDLGVAYGAADVFVFPSVKDTQGLVLAEAALAGLPIVMVDEPVTEIVRHQQNGLIVDNNVEAIAEALTSILQNEELTKNMSKKSIELAAEYSEAKQTAKLIALCQHLVENQSAEPQVKRRRVRKLLTSFGRSVLDE